MKPSDREPPITTGWKATPLPYDDSLPFDRDVPEEYEEARPQTCDECGAVMELLYGGTVMCDECGKHFPERG